MLRRSLLLSLPAAPLALGRPRRVRLGIRTDTYRMHPMAKAAGLMKAAGFEAVQLGLRFADVRFDMNAPDWSYARRARDAFGEAGLPIMGLDGYVNVVHPDLETRRRNVAALGTLLEHAHEFGTTIVGTEAGSFNPGRRGGGRPDDPVAGWKQFIGTMRELVKRAEGAGVTLAFEPTLSTLVGTIEEVRRMLDDVGSPRLKVLWDAAHYYSRANAAEGARLLERMYSTFGRDVVLAHANDYRVNAAGEVEYCDIGDGKLDYRTYIALLDKSPGDILLGAEHTREEDVPRVKRYLDRFFA